MDKTTKKNYKESEDSQMSDDDQISGSKYKTSSLRLGRSAKVKGMNNAGTEVQPENLGLEGMDGYDGSEINSYEKKQILNLLDYRATDCMTEEDDTTCGKASMHSDQYSCSV